MTGFAFRKNTIFERDNTKFRIDRVHESGDVLLERIADGKLLIETKFKLLSEFKEGAISACVVSEEDSRQRSRFSRPMEDLPDNIRQEASRRLRYIKAIAEEGTLLFTHEYLDPIIHRVANAIGDSRPPSISSIFRWHRRFLKEQDPRSLIPHSYLRGPRSPHQNELVLKLAGEAIDEAFKASPRASVQSIYPRLANKIAAENRVRLPEDHLVLPSTRTMYRILNRLQAFDLAILKEGQRIAERRFSVVKAQVEAKEILERVEIDHTPLDLFLIDDRSGLPLGRPTLSVAIDHHSRMLLGFHLCYGDPSLAAVIGVLRHAILPKDPPPNAIPGLTVAHTWNCHGRPKTFVVDNGMEFHANELESVALDLRSELRFCPKHQPRFKGAVERFLKTINYHFVHQLPGTSLARWHLRGDYNSAQNAVLTLSEFNHLFQKWVLDVYAQQVHRGTNETPWHRWHEGLKRVEPELPQSTSDLTRRIGQITERALRHDGIVMFGVRYNGSDLEPILRAYGPGVRLRISYDPEDLGEIHVWSPGNSEPVCVQALDQALYRGLTTLQNRLLRQSLKEKGACQTNRAAVLEARQELVAAVDTLIKSRKQRDRRRAAKIRGLSISKVEPAGTPLGHLGGPEAQEKVQLPRKKRFPKEEASDGTPKTYKFFSPTHQSVMEKPQ